MSKEKTYTELTAIFREIEIINSLIELLDWDEQTYMPSKASRHRADQVAYLAELKHHKLINPEIDRLLQLLEDGSPAIDENKAMAVNIREWRRKYNLQIKLPADLVKELSHTCSRAQKIWRDARLAKDFSIFEPWLEKIIKLKQKQADAIGYDGERYDALLDEYEPGARTAEIAVVLTDLREELIPVLNQIQNTGRKPNSSILKRDFPLNSQEAFAKEAAVAIGYDFKRGRLDVTTHPFCTGLGPNDVRMTTRFNKNFFNPAFFGVLHEAGHGIYEQNLPTDHWGTPRGQTVSLGVHESQSRLWENIVGRSKAFWEFWLPKAKKHFTTLEDVILDDFYFAINEVRPSFIRVEADELTYNLHILLRFELERAMLEGDLKAGDVPGAWNERVEKYFGLKVPNEAKGCLQDVHWSAGLFGYFPTYTIGNLIAGQFYTKADEELGGLDEMFRRGEFAPLLKWLKKNIYSRGMTYRSPDLTKVVTGKPLSSESLVNYMKNKFYRIYGIKV